MGDTTEQPPFLVVGTEVSAKFKGAFCEAKIKKVQKNVTCKVLFLNCGHNTIQNISEDCIISPYSLQINCIIRAKHPQLNNQFTEAKILKIIDGSTYTVEFDDGDIKVLKRNLICLKGQKHFQESQTLDKLPLTNPETFGTPVVTKKAGATSSQSSASSKISNLTPSSTNNKIRNKTSGKEGQKNYKKDAPIIATTPPSIPKIGSKIKKESYKTDNDSSTSTDKDEDDKIPVKRPFSKIGIDSSISNKLKDTLHLPTPKKSHQNFSKKAATRSEKQENVVTSKKLSRHGVKSAGNTNSKSPAISETKKSKPEFSSFEEDDDEVEETEVKSGEFSGRMHKTYPGQSQKPDDESEDEDDEEEEESLEERDHFVARLFKFMEDRATPLNKLPSLGTTDVNYHKLFNVVCDMGYYNKVTNNDKWHEVCVRIGIFKKTDWPKSLVVKRIQTFYKKYLLAFEEFSRKLGCNLMSQPHPSTLTLTTTPTLTSNNSIYNFNTNIGLICTTSSSAATSSTIDSPPPKTSISSSVFVGGELAENTSSVVGQQSGNVLAPTYHHIQGRSLIREKRFSSSGSNTPTITSTAAPFTTTTTTTFLPKNQQHQMAKQMGGEQIKCTSSVKTTLSKQRRRKNRGDDSVNVKAKTSTVSDLKIKLSSLSSELPKKSTSTTVIPDVFSPTTTEKMIMVLDNSCQNDDQLEDEEEDLNDDRKSISSDSLPYVGLGVIDHDVVDVKNELSKSKKTAVSLLPTTNTTTSTIITTTATLKSKFRSKNSLNLATTVSSRADSMSTISSVEIDHFSPESAGTPTPKFSPPAADVSITKEELSETQIAAPFASNLSILPESEIGHETIPISNTKISQINAMSPSIAVVENGFQVSPTFNTTPRRSTYAKTPKSTVASVPEISGVCQSSPLAKYKIDESFEARLFNTIVSCQTSSYTSAGITSYSTKITPPPSESSTTTVSKNEMAIHSSHNNSCVGDNAKRWSPWSSSHQLSNQKELNDLSPMINASPIKMSSIGSENVLQIQSISSSQSISHKKKVHNTLVFPEIETDFICPYDFVTMDSGLSLGARIGKTKNNISVLRKLYQKHKNRVTEIEKILKTLQRMEENGSTSQDIKEYYENAKCNLSTTNLSSDSSSAE